MGKVAPPDVSLHVKNTFITVDEEEAINSMNALMMLAKRQVTEPIPQNFKRQQSGSTALNKSMLAYSDNLFEHDDNFGDQVKPTEDDDEINDEFDWSRLMTGCSLPGFSGSYPSHDTTDADLLGSANRMTPGATPLQLLPLITPSSSLASPAAQCRMPSMGMAASVPEAASTSPNDAQPCPADWIATFTVMIRNLPKTFTQKQMLEEIDGAGFGGCYDFFYLPIDPETYMNKGYAFINFSQSGLAWEFKLQFEGNQFGSDKVATVTPAALQGFEANYAHYCNSRVSRRSVEARPLFLRDGEKSKAPNPRRRRRLSLIDQAARQARQQHVSNGEQQVTTKRQQPEELGTASYIFGGPASTLSNESRPSQAAVNTVRPPQAPSAEARPAQKQQPVASQVNFCPYCGAKVAEWFKFCQFCSAKLQ